MNEETRPWGWMAAAALRAVALLLLLALIVLPMTAQAAAAKTVIPVGRAVGIKLFSDGVVVVGTSEVSSAEGSVNPAKACGLKEGDIITHINSTEVDSIEAVESLLQELEGQAMSIRAIRRDKQIQLTAQAVFCPEDSTYKLGAWIRDSMAGIGTITYYDPATGSFGALGHGINDVDTALLMPLEEGMILPATVAAVRKGEAGTPGQLKGVFDSTSILGVLSSNTNSGVFGNMTDKSWVKGPALEISERSQIHTGKASILSNVSGDTVGEYEIEIVKIFKEADKDCRDCLISVTDPRLLEATGGIVQGMSGSPIIQDGKLVGAVTHVFVNDPTRGYGIFIENMLDAAS